MRFALMALVTFLCPILTITQTENHDSNGESSPRIELRVSPEKSVIRAGEALKAKAEIWNVGDQDLIIAQNIDATFGNSDLELFLEVGSTLQRANTRTVGDAIPDPNPDFAKTFVRNWLTLNKAHCYGTYVYMDPIEFPQLRKPGIYRIRAEYSSRGISSVRLERWMAEAEDVDKLPLKVWNGTINSNFASIQVIASTKKTTEK